MGERKRRRESEKKERERERDRERESGVVEAVIKHRDVRNEDEGDEEHVELGRARPRRHFHERCGHVAHHCVARGGREHKPIDI